MKRSYPDLRSFRMMNDIVKLAQNLRKEHLFVNEQKQQIKGLNEKISNTCDRIFHNSWILRQQRLTLYEWIYSRKDYNLSTSTCEKANLIEQANFIDSYKALNNDSFITELLCYVRNNPELISLCLIQPRNNCIGPTNSNSKSIQSIQVPELGNHTCEPVAQILMSSVYGNAILHEDYMLTLRLLRSLIDKQLSTCEDPRRLLRQKSAAFSAVFKAFTESLLEAKLFLNSTLNDSILHVLGEDEFMLEIDPNKAAIRFATQERHRQASHNNSPTSQHHNGSTPNSTSISNSDGASSNPNQQQQQTKLPEFASNTKLYKTYVTNRLVSFTAKFIEGIRDNIHCLPPSLLWIIKYVYLQLSKDGKLTDRQVRTVCSDLLFSSFICPAILYPDYYGVTDAYISPNGRFNLAQVAQIIQWLAVTNYEKEAEEGSSANIDPATPTLPGKPPTATPTVNPNIAPRLNDIYSKFPPDCVSSILDYVLNNTCDIDQAVDSVANCKDVSRTCFLITESELSLLITFLEPIVPKLDTVEEDSREALFEIIKKSISSFKYPLESHIRCKLKQLPSSTNSSGATHNGPTSSSILGGNTTSTMSSNSSGLGSAGSSNINLASNHNSTTTNGSPRSRRNNMLRRVTRKGFSRSSSSTTDLNSNSNNQIKSGETHCRCVACVGYQVLMVPFINRNSTNYITTILPEEKVDQTPIIENSEVASVNSVASSSLELENENDNLSDMVSAHVSSGRATPNVSGRNTPSQGSSDNADNLDANGGVIQGPPTGAFPLSPG